MVQRAVTHVSLFTGIGGLDLAAEAAGIDTVLQVEREPYALRILERHWPEVPRITDVRDVTRSSIDGPVTVVSGGFPCQPFSSAGKRRGADDDRYLWPELLRIVDELRPAWVIGENVSGLLSIDDGMEIERMLTALEARDYAVRVLHYPAAGVGAYHKRDRVFIVANRKGIKRNERFNSHSNESVRKSGIRNEVKTSGHDVADAEDCGNVRRNGELGTAQEEHHDRRGSENGSGERRTTQSRLGRVAHGLPDWLDGEPTHVPRVATGVKDRAARLKTLGNAVVPAQAYPIFASIAHAETIWRQYCEHHEE